MAIKKNTALDLDSKAGRHDMGARRMATLTTEQRKNKVRANEARNGGTRKTATKTTPKPTVMRGKTDQQKRDVAYQHTTGVASQEKVSRKKRELGLRRGY